MVDLAGHRSIALDANILIYLFGIADERSAIAAAIIDAIEAGDVAGVISAVGVAEVLAGPARSGDAPAFETAAAAIREMRLRVVTFDHAIAEDAAWIRGSTGYDLADAAHLATARASGATAFITNDRRIRSIPRLEVLYLGDLAA